MPRPRPLPSPSPPVHCPPRCWKFCPGPAVAPWRNCGRTWTCAMTWPCAPVASRSLWKSWKRSWAAASILKICCALSRWATWPGCWVRGRLPTPRQPSAVRSESAPRLCSGWPRRKATPRSAPCPWTPAARACRWQAGRPWPCGWRTTACCRAFCAAWPRWG